MITGSAAFVLPAFDNTSYIEIDVGDQFGMVDIISSAQNHEFDLGQWFNHKNQLQRIFTIQAKRDIEV